MAEMWKVPAFGAVFHLHHNSEDAGGGTYSLLSLSEKTRTSNHLQRHPIVLSYMTVFEDPALVLV